MSIDSPPPDTKLPMMEDPSARIERLLEQLRHVVSPLAWQRVEELARALVDLYGRGLERLVGMIAARGALDDGLRDALAGDELVASLLALHGLHPWPPERRIERALDRIAPQLGRVEIVEVEGGRVRLRALDPPRAAGVAEALEELVLEAAPELERVEIDGLRPRQAGPLVQIDLARSRAGR